MPPGMSDMSRRLVHLLCPFDQNHEHRQPESSRHPLAQPRSTDRPGVFSSSAMAGVECKLVELIGTGLQQRDNFLFADDNPHISAGKAGT